MATALILTLDDEFQQAWAELAEELEHHGVSTLRAQGIPAHVTLALGEGFERVSYSGLAMPRFPEVACDGVATFGATEGTYFLTVRPNAEMLTCSQTVHHWVAGIPVVHDRHYVPGDWLPHVTVATGVSPEQAPTVVETTRWHLPIIGRAARLELWNTVAGTRHGVLAQG